MNRFILVVALAAACSSPAFAGPGKVRANHAYNAYPTPSWVLARRRHENANGLAEIAVNQGRADCKLGLAIGSSIKIIS